MGAGDWYRMVLQTADPMEQARRQAVEQKVHAILEATAATVEEWATHPAAFEELEGQAPELEGQGPVFMHQEMSDFPRDKMQEFILRAADALQREALQIAETGYATQQEGFLDTLTSFLQEMWTAPVVVAAMDTLVLRAVQRAVLQAAKLLETRLRIPWHLTIRLLRTVLQSLQTELAKPAYLKAAETRGRVFGIPTERILEQDQERLEAAIRSDRMPLPYGRS